MAAETRAEVDDNDSFIGSSLNIPRDPICSCSIRRYRVARLWADTGGVGSDDDGEVIPRGKVGRWTAAFSFPRGSARIGLRNMPNMIEGTHQHVQVHGRNDWVGQRAPDRTLKNEVS